MFGVLSAMKRTKLHIRVTITANTTTVILFGYVILKLTGTASVVRQLEYASMDYSRINNISK